MSKLFIIEEVVGSKNGMTFDKKVTFYDEKGNVEAEYFYFNNKVNYLLSWGFNKDSLGELRKTKANKTKKPFFSFEMGWYS